MDIENNNTRLRLSYNNSLISRKWVGKLVRTIGNLNQLKELKNVRKKKNLWSIWTVVKLRYNLWSQSQKLHNFNSSQVHLLYKMSQNRVNYQHLFKFNNQNVINHFKWSSQNCQNQNSKKYNLKLSKFWNRS